MPREIRGRLARLDMDVLELWEDLAATPVARCPMMVDLDPPCTYCGTGVWPRVCSETHNDATGEHKTVWTCEPCLLQAVKNLTDQDCAACADVADKLKDTVSAHRRYRRTGEMTMVIIPQRVHEHRPGCEFADA